MPPARPASQYVCQACAAAYPRWEGQCRACGAWNSLVETLVRQVPRRAASATRPAPGDGDRPVPLGGLSASAGARLVVGLHEVDRVLGGGLVPGSVLLLGGEPGIGKSTLVLQVAAAVAGHRRSVAAGGDHGHGGAGPRGVLYASAEESTAQLATRATRLGIDGAAAATELRVMASLDVEAIISAASDEPPAMLVVDSVQTVDAGLEGPPGSVGQVREAAARLGTFARGSSVTVLLVGHVTKDGTLAGPRTLEHLVDVVLMLEGDRYGSLRLLRAQKNRFGSTEEIGVLEMTPAGLAEVADTAALFLGGGSREAPGVSVAAILEGSRPLLVEVQALVGRSGLGPPRRTAAGVDASRLSLLLAVLGRRAGVEVESRDVYVSLGGGMSADEPALDLAVALAIASTRLDRPLRPDTVTCGEVTLLGEVRPVRGLERRLREAARLGFRRAVVPDGVWDPGRHARETAGGLEVVVVPTLRAALEAALLPPTGPMGQE